MPLVVPGINSNGGGDLTQEWMQKLAGKKISESGSTDNTNFAKKDLPQNHRVVGEDTMDHQPNRLNIHTDKDGLVKKVTHG
ncbi:hypothetical protein LTS08_002149 [Lithohypha guttulata]|uniref:Uncharacterized protein n=1 Tax=Lithohypha guttulata TaxID=1690604 RepID=A0AAN7TE01_9EURO|nr:hypothetical protein LTR51_004333 [Lithohypha guttulata]KAK5090941.1 hypothetical protein LTR05_001119 [Lithohypha guttulata]KAK5104262.1 hypothetical protein LTS08_002149 [Lithohypha guttulata]